MRLVDATKRRINYGWLGLIMLVVLMMSITLWGCSSGQSVSSASSTKTQSEVPESIIQTYVGTWELTGVVMSDGRTIGAEDIEQMHQRGRESFMNITDEKTATFNYLGGYEFGTWDVSSDSDFTLQLMAKDVSDINCDGNTLTFKWMDDTYSFVRGEAKDAPFLFEYQEWMSPFIGSWHLVSAEKNGYELPDSGQISLTLESSGKAVTTFSDTTSSDLWMATSSSTGILYEHGNQADGLSIVDSMLVMDMGEYILKFERD